MKYKLLIVAIILASFFGCQEKETELIQLQFQKDLIPEGIAVNGKTDDLFLSSLKECKIVTSKLDGKNPKDFIKNGEYGCLSGFGMTIKNNILYSLSNSRTKKKNRSLLLMLDIKTGDLINSFALNDTSFIYLNDLAVSNKNEVYITDSENNRIYKVIQGKKDLEVFIESDEVIHSNGITISPDDKYLYVGSGAGIRCIDIATKEILNKPNEPIQEYLGIDGLKYYKNSLIGIINIWRDKNYNGVYRFYLNEAGTEIITKEKIVAYDENFMIPTTLDIYNDYLYFVINTQLANLKSEITEVKDESSLQSYILMKRKIEE